MPNPQGLNSLTRATRLAAEVTPGVAVQPNLRLQSVGFKMKPAGVFSETMAEGFQDPSSENLESESSDGTFDGKGSYIDQALLFDSLFGKATPTVLATGVYRRVWIAKAFEPDDYASFTALIGDTSSGELYPYTVVTSNDLSFSRTDVTSKGNVIAQRVQEPYLITSGAAVNQVMTITLTNTPTGGTWIFKGEDPITGDTLFSGAIPYNADHTALQTALEGVYGAGNITVAAGSAGGPYTGTFAGTLAGVTVPLPLAPDASLLTGAGMAPGVNVVTTILGAASDSGTTLLPNETILGSQVSVFADESLANIGTTQLVIPFSLDFSIGAKRKPVWAMNAGFKSWPKTVIDKSAKSLKLLVEATAEGWAFLRHARRQETLFLRTQATGRRLDSTHTNLLQIDTPCQVKSLPDPGDHDGTYTVSPELTPVYDPGAGYALKITLVNSLASY